MKVRWIQGRGMYANAFVCGEVLVDAGVSPDAVAPYSDRITHIVLTHGHFDHIAHVKELALLCQAKICIHESDAPALIHDQLSLAMHFGACSPKVTPDILLAEGDEIGGLSVLHTPGHTRGSICLYDPDSRSLISGDTVFTDGAFGRYDFPGGSVEDLRASLEKLELLPVRGLYPGHGVALDDGGLRNIHAALTLIRGMFL